MYSDCLMSDIIRTDEGYPSLPLFQFVLWIFVIIYVFLSVGFIRIFSGLTEPFELSVIPVNLITLFGISNLITLADYSISEIRKGFRSRGASKLPLSSMLKDFGTLRLYRLQMFWWTLIAITVYLLDFFSNMRAYVGTEELLIEAPLIVPDINLAFVILMVLSQAAYLAGRILTLQSMEVTEFIPADGIRSKNRDVSLLGSSFGNDRGSVWLGNYMIRMDDRVHLKDWSNNRIDINVPVDVPAGDYTNRIQKYNGGGMFVRLSSFN